MNLQTYVEDLQLQKLLKGRGITDLNPLQIQSVQAGLFFHRNVMVSAPSGSGKTLIGTLAVGNTLFMDLGCAVYLVPYKALAVQKEEEFTEAFEPFGLNAKAVTGDTEFEDANLAEVNLLISTY